MKYHALFAIFEKKNGKIFNCRLLQIIGGALRVKDMKIISSVYTGYAIKIIPFSP